MVAVIPGWIRDRLFGVGDIQHEEPIGEKADPILLDEEEVIFPIIPPRHDDEPLPTIDGTFRDLSHTDDSLRMSIVELYHRLQNLSDYPHAPSLARRYFLASIVKAVREATAEPASSSSILSLPTRFNAMALEHWLKAETEQTTGRLGEYVKRRKAGGGREMFRDREDAVRWCRESAVVKYVDGSWLQGTFRCTSGTNLAVNDVLSVLNGLSSGSGGSRRVKEGVKAERRAARTSWQVLSEELGDGDLERSHVAAYQSLMDSLSSQDRSGPAPRGYQRRFVSWLAGPDGDSDQPDKQPWIAALLQLTITSSPDEFLPEILGFNVSYEGLPLHLLITTKELRELAIDPYYFVLHISIDNGDSGHSAMARMAVTSYLESAESIHGPEVADALWRRVQAGFILADSVRTTPAKFNESVIDPPDWTQGIEVCDDDLDVPTPPQGEGLAECSTKLLKLFRRKADATQGLHASVAARIGGRPISAWLTSFILEEEGEEFIRALANSRAWICPGDAEKSRLFREFSWGGRMFGAFTRSETAVLRQWISMLPIDVSPIDPSLPMAATRDPLPSSAAIDGKQLDRYWDFVYGANRIRDTQNIQLHPLQPVDLTERFQTMSSWSDWLASAPQTFKTILQSPNAIRFWRSDIDTIPFLRSLVCEPLPSFPTAADLVHHISTIDIPSITTLNCLQAIWYTSIAPLEWIPSSSPSKLASPLGMAIVKVLRCIHGFSEGDLGEGSDPGCLGADDVHVMLDGIWEIGPDIFTQHSDGTTLSRFTSGTGRELALPTLILALNSRPARSVPILLGMALALNICLHDMPCVRATLLKKPTARQRLSEITGRSRQWLVTAIDIGLEATTTKKPVVGWDGEGDWAEGVALGVALGVRGVRTACV